MPVAVSQCVSVHFELDKSREPIKMEQPLSPQKKYEIHASGWTNSDLENCVVMAPIKYTEDVDWLHLPAYLPIYSYEWGRSKYTIQRRYNNNIVSVHLVTDLNFAKWAISVVNPTTQRKD